MGERPLNPKQELFCREYIVDLNGKRAAIRAGYSAKTAETQASDLLRVPKVAAFVQSLMNSRSQLTGINSEFVLRELMRLASVDLSQAYNEDGGLKKIHDIPEDVRRAISQVEVFDEFDGYGKDRTKIGETVKVKFYDKNKALELIGRHLKLFTDKVEHSGTITLEDLVPGSNQ